MATSTPKPVGRPSTVTPAMRADLREMLDIRPDMERHKMKDYFKNKFNLVVSESALTRVLRS